MFTANNENEIQVNAYEATKGNKFHCPYCKEKVTLKQGRNISAHFAHRKDSECPYRTNESILHHNTKIEVFNRLMEDPYFQCIEFEKRFKNTRADIFAKFDGVPVAIEIQVSAMSENDIDERLKRWAAEGVHVLFITVGLQSKYKYSEVRKRALWNYLQRLYYGKLYYWDENNLYVTHLNSVSRGLCRRRPPEQCSDIISFKDLKPTKREAFKELPECLIMTDRIKAWWKVISHEYNKHVMAKYGMFYNPTEQEIQGAI